MQHNSLELYNQICGIKQTPYVLFHTVHNLNFRKTYYSSFHNIYVYVIFFLYKYEYLQIHLKFIYLKLYTLMLIHQQNNIILYCFHYISFFPLNSFSYFHYLHSFFENTVKGNNNQNTKKVSCEQKIDLNILSVEEKNHSKIIFPQKKYSKKKNNNIFQYRTIFSIHIFHFFIFRFMEEKILCVEKRSRKKTRKRRNQYKPIYSHLSASRPSFDIK